MAYRRKQGIQRSATFVEDHRQTTSSGGSSSSSSPAIASPRATRFADDSRRPERSSPLAARGGDLSLPVFGERFSLSGAAAAASLVDSQPSSPMQDPVTQLYTSTTKLNDDGPKYDLELSKKDDARHGLWSLVAQKAKVMLDENGTPRTQEGLAAADNTTPGAGSSAVVAQKLQIRRKACSMDFRSANLVTSDMSPRLSDDVESPQIKASRDVANAMAAKVKLLQRELKTLKADLAFSKERCAQLEEENRQLRDGNQDADEDMIRQQLETLLAEKARLANENTLYARENRFLREIVEYHQLNMQDVVNLDDDDDNDDIEEEDEDDVVDDAEEFEQYGGRDTSSPSQLDELVHEDEEHQAAGPGTAPRSPSTRHTESPRTQSPNSSGGAMDNVSPRMVNTDSGGAMGDKSPRVLSTNSGAMVDHESPRMLSTNSGGSAQCESPMLRRSKDDGSSPETATDG
ncbi:hypothetical protein HU200_024166 [Digitaria exilis]|uniref:Uncharacterized protein n=1 Tax=Digitaria exilis TaxID=1010633 RepID=A0A835EY34_9POAL|nr:hypothetical protein HU200_024166 [Digitaria exilis]